MSGGLIDQNDVQNWKTRVNKAIENKAWSSASPAGARPWNNSLFSCFSPPETCCISCCLPCVTFGKTYHRLHKDGNMEGYEPINTSCIGFYVASCFGAHWIMQWMQLSEIREQHNLEGSCMKDLLKTCCCFCCSIVQAEKETKERVGEKVVDQQYGGAPEQMVMGAQNTA